MMPLIEAGFNWIGGSGDLEKLLTAEDAENSRGGRGEELLTAKDSKKARKESPQRGQRTN
jgi:hypothetical protein